MKFYFILFILFLLFSSVLVQAIRISPAKFDDVRPFIEGESTSFQLRITNNAEQPFKVVLSAEGFIPDSVKFSEDSFYYFPWDTKTITVNVTYPRYDSLSDFGIQKIYFKATEVSDPRFQSGAFAAVTSIRIPAKIDVPIPGKFLNIKEITIPNVEKGENTNMTLLVENKGVLDVDGAKAEVKIFDTEGNKLDSIIIDGISLKPNEEKEYFSDLSTDDFASGIYLAKGELTYDVSKAPSKKETSFVVNGLDIILVNYTRELVKGKINKVNFELRSIYNKPIKGIRASFKSIGGDLVKLPVIDFEPFQKITSSTYIDVPKNNDTEFETLLNLTIPAPELGGDQVKKLNLKFYLVNETKISIPYLPKQKMATSTKVFLIIMVIIVLAVLLLLLLSLKHDKKKDGSKGKNPNTNKLEVKKTGGKNNGSKNSEEFKKTSSSNNKENNSSFDWTK